MSTTVEAMGHFVARSRSCPSKKWYWAALATVLVGIAAGITWGTLATLRTHDRAARLPHTSLPGRLQVAAPAGTSVLVYFAGEGKPSPAALGLSVAAPDGSPVPLQPYDVRMEYEIAGWTGTPIASFSAPSAGAYTVSATKSFSEGALSAGGNFVRAQLVDLAGALGLIWASITIGLVIGAVVFVKRSTAGTRREGAPGPR